MKQASEFVDLLKQQQLITNVSDNCIKPHDSPWYIKTLMGFCGWLAAIFLLGLLGAGLESLFDSPLSLTVLGLVMISGSFYFLKTSQSEFVEHLGLALSFAGQGLIVFALFKFSELQSVGSWLVLTLMQGTLAMLMPSYMHRVISAYLATCCFSYLLFLVEISTVFSSLVLLLVAFLWLREFTLGQQVRKIQAVTYGVVIGLMQFKFWLLFAHQNSTWSNAPLPTVNPYVDEALNILVLLVILQQLIQHKKLPRPTVQSWHAIAVVLLMCVGTFYANGIVSGLIVIVLGFAIQNKVLLTIGILAALLNLSAYYYLLDISLLNKSLILTAMGASALVLFYVGKGKHNEI